MSKKDKEIEILIEHVVQSMRILDIFDIHDSKMSSSSRQLVNNIWLRVVEAYNKTCLKTDQKYKEAMRIRSLWVNNSNNFKEKVKEKLNQTQKNNQSIGFDENELEISIAINTWNELITKHASNGKRKIFLLKFHHYFAKLIQTQGIKCWLECKSNYFETKNKVWSGTYKCKQNSCKMEYHASLISDDFFLDKIIIRVKFNGISNHEEKVKDDSNGKRCSGLSRKKIGLQIMSDGITNVSAIKTNKFYETQNEEYNHQSKKNILKQIKYEVRHKNRLSTDHVVDLMAAKMMSNKMMDKIGNILGIVRNSSLDPYGFTLLCDITINIWKIVQEFNPIWNFDATGSVIKKINGQKAPFYYSIVVHDNHEKKIIPLASFLTTCHTADSIALNLTNIKNILFQNINQSKFYVVAPIIVVDHSWALIQAVLKSMNNVTALQYLNWWYGLIVQKENEKKFIFITTVYICSTHMLKIILKSVKKYAKIIPEKVCEALKFCFTLLQNSKTIEQFDIYLKHIYILFNSKYISEALKISTEYLANELLSRDAEINFDFYENENLKKFNLNTEYKKTVVQEFHCEENLTKDSPFSAYYADKMREWKSDLAIDSSKLKLNDFFSPDLFKIIKEKLHILPLWTGFVFQRITSLNHITRISNVPVESSFHTLKNLILNHLVVMASTLIASLCTYLAAIYKQLYESKVISSFKQKQNKPEETERWSKKNEKKKKKKNNKDDGYFKKSSVLGTSISSTRNKSLIDCFNLSNEQSSPKNNLNDDSSSLSSKLSEKSSAVSSNDSSSIDNSSSDSSSSQSLSSLSSNNSNISATKIIKFENFTKKNINVCYANSAIQSLLGCGKILHDLIQKNMIAKNCQLSMLLGKIKNKEKKGTDKLLSSFEFRKLANISNSIESDSYLNKDQQCSFLFLTHLIEQSNETIKNLFKIQVQELLVCCLCSKTITRSNEFYHLQIFFENSDENFQNVLKNLENNERIEHNCDEPNCDSKHKFKTAKYDLTNNNNLLLRIDNFEYHIEVNLNGISKSTISNSKIRIKNFSSNLINVFGFNYKVATMVRHSGDYDKGGHFSCIRNINKKWINISDSEFSFCKDPARNYLKDIFYIVLEKLI